MNTPLTYTKSVVIYLSSQLLDVIPEILEDTSKWNAFEDLWHQVCTTMSENREAESQALKALLWPTKWVLSDCSDAGVHDYVADLYIYIKVTFATLSASCTLKSPNISKMSISNQTLAIPLLLLGLPTYLPPTPPHWNPETDTAFPILVEPPLPYQRIQF